MPLRKNIGLAQFYEIVRTTTTSTSRPRRRYILSFGIHELFHLITNTNLKLLKKKILCVANNKSVDAHAINAMVVWHLFSRRSSSCSICTLCSTTKDSWAFKANGFVCLMACKSTLKSLVSLFLLSIKNLNIYLLVW